MNSQCTPANESERLDMLYSFGLMGLGKMPELDIFAELACRITACPSSIIAIMEEDMQRIQSCFGINLETVERRNTVCQYTMMSEEPLMIEDTFQDPRTKDNPLIRAAEIRFYAGVPLLDDRGLALGTLCVVDFVTKTISEEQLSELAKLADAVVALLLAKRKSTQAAYFKQILSVTQNMICVLDDNFIIKEVNPAFADLMAFSTREAVGKSFPEVLQANETVLKALQSTIQTNGEVQVQTRTETPSEEEAFINWNLKYNPDNKEIFAFGRDISKENAEKVKLLVSERRFRNFFENGIGLMSMHDLNGNILRVNEMGRKVLGYSSHEVQGLNLLDLVPSENRSLIKPYLERIKQKGEDSGMMVLRHKDGEWIYWLYNNILEIDADGSAYVVSSALNMNERITLEKDLQHTKQILEQSSQVAQVGGWEVDLAKNEVYWSGPTRQIHGVSDDFKPTLENGFSFFDDEDSQAISELFKTAILSGKSYDIETRLKRASGEYIWIRIKGVPEIIDGRCTRVFGIMQDIDQTKQLFLELERKESMLQTFVDYVPASVAMFDQDLNYLTISKQWKEEFHYIDNHVPNRNLYEVFPNIPERRKEIYRKALEGIPYKNTDELVKREEHEHAQHYNWEVRPWRLPDGTIGGIIIFSQNISELVAKNEELKNAKKLADIGSKAKSEFLANMSHEIRTPLNGVIGFSDLLLKTPLNDLQKQYLKYVNESGNNLLSIINDILDFSKIESGKLEFYIDQYNPYELVNQVIHVILYQAQNKGIELLLNIEQGLPDLIYIDESRIKQVLINLLGNAVKFTETGEIELRVERTNIEQDKVRLRFSVRDTGIGISEEKQHRIFDAFMQEDSSVSKRFGGTGLGLTISNNILRYMGSELSLQSKVNEGSIFSFEIEVPYEYTEEQNDDLSVENVLIVDDNVNNRVILEHMLAYKGVKTTSVGNGFEAIQLYLDGKRFDAILMDYRMPILNGLETIGKIKEFLNQQGEPIPLLVSHCSSDDQEHMTQFRQEQNSYCLTKPIISEELYRILRQTQTTEKSVVEEQESAKDLDKAFRVLVADDNPVNMALNLRLVEGVLPQCETASVENGVLAVEACEGSVFDLILMDIQMPLMDGIEATQRIRTLKGYEQVPIIGITAGNVIGEKEKCLEVGMTDFLTKPIKAGDFKTMVTKAMQALEADLVSEIEMSAHFDESIMDESTDNDADFKQEFIGIVLGELELQKERLNLAREESDVPQIKKLLHKLRGTSSTAGLILLNRMAADMEEKFVNGNLPFDEISNLTNEIELLQKLLIKIKT